MKYDENIIRKQEVLALVLYVSCILTRQARWYSICRTGQSPESVDCRSGSPPDRVGDQGGTPASGAWTSPEARAACPGASPRHVSRSGNSTSHAPREDQDQDPRPPRTMTRVPVGNYSITSIAARPLVRHSPLSMADEARRVAMEAFSRHNHHRMQSYAHRTCFWGSTRRGMTRQRANRQAGGRQTRLRLVGSWTYYTPERHPALVLGGIRVLPTAPWLAHVSSPKKPAGSDETGLEDRGKESLARCATEDA